MIVPAVFAFWLHRAPVMPAASPAAEKPPHAVAPEGGPPFPGPSRGAPRPRAIGATVTGYTKDDPGMDGRGITSTGTKARRGVAAVDPEVIPLGSVIFVPGYGVAVAEDTGGAVRGSRIDLYFDTREEAFEWGRKKLRVEIRDKE